MRRRRRRRRRCMMYIHMYEGEVVDVEE